MSKGSVEPISNSLIMTNGHFDVTNWRYEAPHYLDTEEQNDLKILNGNSKRNIKKNKINKKKVNRKNNVNIINKKSAADNRILNGNSKRNIKKNKKKVSRKNNVSIINKKNTADNRILRKSNSKKYVNKNKSNQLKLDRKARERHLSRQKQLKRFKKLAKNSYSKKRNIKKSSTKKSKKNKKKNVNGPVGESKLNELIRTNKTKMFKIFKGTRKQRNKYKKKYKSLIFEKGYGQKTALHESIRNKKCPVSFVRSLLEWSPEIDACDYKGNTSLHYAAQLGAKEKAYWLIQSNADVNARNNYGYTPLHLACQYGWTDLAELLIDNGAIVNIQNKFSYRPIHFAAESSTPGLVYLLLSNGAYAHVKTKYGHTPIMRSIKFGNKDDIALLFAVKSYNYNNKLLLEVCPDDEIKSFVLEQMRFILARRLRNILKHEFRSISRDKRSFISIKVGVLKPSKKQNYYDAPKRFRRKF